MVAREQGIEGWLWTSTGGSAFTLIGDEAPTGALLFTTLVFALSGSPSQPPLYWVAHGLKIVGGITGGIVANKRNMNRRTLART